MTISNDPVSLGTSIMAVRFSNGVILGADSRTTTGAYIANRVSNKLTPLSSHIFCCRSGSAADTQALADIVNYYLSILRMQMMGSSSSTSSSNLEGNGESNGETGNAGSIMPVQLAANIFGKLCYENRDKLQAGIIVAGWDKERNGRGSVYNIPLGGSVHEQPFAIGGSGSTYIYGYCDANYREGMTADECEKFVINALALAMSRDGSSGGIIRLAIITEGGVEKKTIAGDQLPLFWEG